MKFHVLALLAATTSIFAAVSQSAQAEVAAQFRVDAFIFGPQKPMVNVGIDVNGYFNNPQDVVPGTYRPGVGLEVIWRAVGDTHPVKIEPYVFGRTQLDPKDNPTAYMRNEARFLLELPGKPNQPNTLQFNGVRLRSDFGDSNLQNGR
jgi:hypothetical protein